MSLRVAPRAGLPHWQESEYGSGQPAAWHHAVGEHRMHDARAAAKPAGDRAQDESDESHQRAGRDYEAAVSAASVAACSAWSMNTPGSPAG